jgi:hypothetical protein
MHTSVPKRLYRVSFRVSLEERRILEAAAKRSGRSLSDFARAALFAARPLRKARAPAIEATLLACILAKLGIVASALRDIADAALRAKEEVAFLPSLERDLARNLKSLGACRTQIMSALRRKAEPS